MTKITKYAFFLLLCLLSGTVFGQGTGSLYTNSIDGSSSLIRHYKLEASEGYITYSHPSSTENHFALTDIHTMMIDAHVADLYDVRDFEIIDGYVFFCGQNTSGSGFLGWFDINSLFYYGGQVYIDETLNIYGLESLDNIEVYRDRYERIHIAGVGAYTAVGGSTQHRAFEAVGDPLTGMQYKVADLAGWERNATLIVTDDYVVYASVVRHTHGAGIGINLEPFPKDDMFPTPNHPNYFFQTVGTNLCGIPYGGPTAWDSYGQKICITNKGNNTIAVCGYRSGVIGCTPYFSDGIFQLVIREFDLTPLLYLSPIQMVSDVRIPLPYNVGSLHEMVYDPPTQHYVVMFHHETSPTVYETAILTADYSSGLPSSADATYQSPYNYWIPSGLCIAGGSQYTVCGWDNPSPFHNYYFWQDYIYSICSGCCVSQTYSATKEPIEVEKEDEQVSNVVGWNPLNFIPNILPEIVHEPNHLKCN